MTMCRNDPWSCNLVPRRHLGSCGTKEDEQYVPSADVSTLPTEEPSTQEQSSLPGKELTYHVPTAAFVPLRPL